MSILAADNKMKKIFLIALIPMMILTLGTSSKKSEDTRKNLSGYIPKTGFVPNAATAIKIAEAVLFPIYGKSTFSSKSVVLQSVHSASLSETETCAGNQKSL